MISLKKFLKETLFWNAYKKNFIRYRKIKESAFDEEFRLLLEGIPPIHYIFSSFEWKLSEEGLIFWDRIDQLWREKLLESHEN